MGGDTNFFRSRFFCWRVRWFAGFKLLLLWHTQSKIFTLSKMFLQKNIEFRSARKSQSGNFLLISNCTWCKCAQFQPSPSDMYITAGICFWQIHIKLPSNIKHFQRYWLNIQGNAVATADKYHMSNWRYIWSASTDLYTQVNNTPFLSCTHLMLIKKDYRCCPDKKSMWSFKWASAAIDTPRGKNL